VPTVARIVESIHAAHPGIEFPHIEQPQTTSMMGRKIVLTNERIERR
jgi:hypothetical protein